MTATEPPTSTPRPTEPPERPPVVGIDGPYQPAPSGRGWYARAFMPIGLGLVVLGGAACDPPGDVVRADNRNGVVNVIGTDGPDAITVRLQAGDPSVLQVDVGADGTADFSFDRAEVTGILVRAWGGGDTIVADHTNGAFTDTLATTFLGGDGDDTLVGSVGAERFEGGAGLDRLDGRQGVDTLLGGDGDDTFPWNPGDSSDVVVGGAGSDRSQLNGSSIGENFEVSNIDGHVRLTRDVATVALDLDEVEAIDVRALGGTDVLRANDVTGTDLVSVTADFAANGGGDDGVVDRLVVAPGAALGHDGPAATVDGLGAQYRVVNGAGADQVHVVGTGGADEQPILGTDGADTVSVTANGTDVAVVGVTGPVMVNLSAVETLDVDLGDGADSFSAVGNLATLIALDVDGGSGPDTILGSNGADELAGGVGADFIDGQQGTDAVDGGGGDDTFGWDPGDSSDVLVGGDGADRLLFNGSAASENYAVSAVGDHVRFTRDVASVALDLDEVEAIDVRALGGTDVLRPGDVTGTDLLTVTADFAATGGGDDAALDRMLVPAGLALGHDGPVGTVDGLGAQYRVINPAGADQIHVVGNGSLDPQPIVGTDGADTVSVTANGPDVAVFGVTGSVLVNLSTVYALDIDLGDGDDSFSATGNLAALTSLDVDGGPGADTISGSNGADLLHGGDGPDFIDGQQGIDQVFGDDGDDTFQWDAGDGTEDTLEGGVGADRLVFNGSAANEDLQVSSIGDRVRFTDLASILLGFDDIEALDVRALGGTDLLRVHDLTPTDLETVTADFAATFGGGDDGVMDRVMVPPGMALGWDGSAATVDGLGAQVRVVNGASTDWIHVAGTGGVDVQPIVGTPGADTVSVTANGPDVAVFGVTGPMLVNLSAVDSLDVDLGGGDDSFSATGNIAALTTLDVDGGPGADTILGSNGADLLAGGTGADFVDGQQGLDQVAGGDDGDTFQWDPGDGSDALVGGAGNDRLLFNGSAADEIYDVSRVGDHVRFTRNLGSIVMDLHEVEALDVRAFGGVDQLNALDLTGTHLSTVTADFAAPGGGDDGAMDRLLVPHGLALGWDGTAATVDGLGAQLRVVNGAGSDRIHLWGTGAADVQSITGTSGADTVSVTANGTDVAVFGLTGQMLVNLSAVEALDIDLGDGADAFSATGNLAALIALDVDGGPGADTISGSNGADVLAGGTGSDFIDGQQANDTINGGNDQDTFQWDPGDGSDVLVGGAGTDRLVFNGSAIGEIFEVSNLAGHVRFTRNVATIGLDLDEIEALDVRAMAGTDTLTVQDLTGTDLTAVTADLAQFGGTVDGVLDQVVVNGTSGADTVAVAHEGAAVVVGGLPATVRIAGADALIDRLFVNGLGGADTVDATPGAAALILLSLAP